MIERCTDYRRIKKFVEHICISNRVYYLVEIQDGSDQGVWTFHPLEDGGGLCIHVNMGRECRGRAVVESAKAAFAWVFNNTPYQTIFAAIPGDKRAAQLVARWSGMQFIRADNQGCRYYQIGPEYG